MLIGWLKGGFFGVILLIGLLALGAPWLLALVAATIPPFAAIIERRTSSIYQVSILVFIVGLLGAAFPEARSQVIRRVMNADQTIQNLTEDKDKQSTSVETPEAELPAKEGGRTPASSSERSG